ncbi:helix-turn-helix domain-containing protein [Radiobacillus sp. PE A8.2]|uniref:helix-turn-helix domain-containing protein n=1 Tax=Radiobacillus sp. PE A8.2 TaxID=3380349 RepID=UPI0038904B0F
MGKLSPKKFFHQNRIFLIYFLSYLTVIIIPILFIGIFSYYVFMDTVEDEISRANTNSLKQISRSINDVLNEVNTISVQIGLDGELYAYSRDTSNHFLLNDIRDKIKTITSSNQDIHSIQIYFKDNNKILSSAGLTHTYIEGLGDSWVTEMKASNPNHFWMSTREILNSDGQAERVVTLVRRLPVAFSDKHGIIAINLNEDKLARIMQEMENNNRVNVYIASATGEKISSFIQQELTGIDDHLDAIEQLGDEGSFIDRERDPATLVSYVKGLNNDWMLVSETHLNYLMERLSYIKNITNLICGVLIFVGIIISYFLSRSMYNPIKRLLEKSKRYQKELAIQMPHEGNDFSFLSGVMDKAVIKNKYLEGEIKAYAPALKERFMFNLLHNKFVSVEEIQKQMNSLQLNLSKENYIAIVVELDDYFSLKEKYPMEEISIYKFAMNNIAEEIVKKCYPCMCTDINERQNVILVNIKTEADDWQENIEDLVKQSQKTIHDIFGISLSISIGGLYKDISQVFLSYHEALNGIKRKVVSGNNAVIFYDHHQDNEIINYIYPSQLERNFVNYIKVGNEEKIIQFAHDIKNEMKNRKNLTHENIYRLYSRLLDAAVQALTEHNGSVSDLFGDNYILYQELAKRETVDHIHEWIADVLVRISVFISEERSDKNQSKIDIVLAYMKNHYTQDLSVEEIAESVNLNPAYLSRIFKQSVGKTMVEYLTEIRLQKSVELLSESTLTVKEIAESVGYNNVNSYIRFFKKYEGMTPGEYRKNRLSS